MCDLTEKLIIARRKLVYKGVEDFSLHLAGWLSQCSKSLQVFGDIESGEQWVWVQGVAMLNTKIGIAFVSEGSSFCKRIENTKELETVIVKDYDKQDWSIELEKLKREIPEIEWHACGEAVNPAKFSIKELYYATV